jgi:hypothetical protein
MSDITGADNQNDTGQRPWLANRTQRLGRRASPNHGCMEEASRRILRPKEL